MSSLQVRTEIVFADGTSMVIDHPRQATGSQQAILAHIEDALAAEKLLVEAEGTLWVIPVRNVKYIAMSPPPDALPAEAVRGARVVLRPAAAWDEGRDG